MMIQSIYLHTFPGLAQSFKCSTNTWDHSFTRNLESAEGENDTRKYFMLYLHEKMLLDREGIKPMTSWSTVRCTSDWATKALPSDARLWSTGMEEAAIHLAWNTAMSTFFAQVKKKKYLKTCKWRSGNLTVRTATYLLSINTTPPSGQV